MYQNKHEDELVDSVDGQRKVNRFMQPIALSTENLSRVVDLRQWMSPVEQQGDMNTW